MLHLSWWRLRRRLHKINNIFTIFARRLTNFFCFRSVDVFLSYERRLFFVIERKKVLFGENSNGKQAEEGTNSFFKWQIMSC